MYVEIVIVVSAVLFRKRLANIFFRTSALCIYALREYRKNSTLRSTPAAQYSGILGAIAFGDGPTNVSIRVSTYYHMTLSPTLAELRKILPRDARRLAIILERDGNIFVSIIDLAAETIQTRSGEKSLLFDSIEESELEPLDPSILGSLAAETAEKGDSAFPVKLAQ